MSSNPPAAVLPPVPARQLPVALRILYWSAHRRRPAFLALLVTGLVLFLAWLPRAAQTSLWMAFSAQRWLVILLFLFAVVTMSLVWTAGQRLDVRIFMLFNTQRYPRWLDRVMWLATQIGTMLAAFLAAIIFWFLNDHRLAIEIVFGTITLWLLVEMVKALSIRERPFRTLEAARVIGWKERGDSFPSGHTTQIFFMVTLLVYRFQLGIVEAVVLYSVAALVGFTRVYVGAHYPRDVIAGVVLGSVWGILTAMIDPYWHFLSF